MRAGYNQLQPTVNNFFSNSSSSHNNGFNIQSGFVGSSTTAQSLLPVTTTWANSIPQSPGQPPEKSSVFTNQNSQFFKTKTPIVLFPVFS